MMVANTSEYVVPNYAGGGDAIFNQDMVKTMGLPAGAKKLNAAGGFVPNFARTAAPVKDPRFALITPDKNAGRFAVGKSNTGKSYQFPIFGYNDSKLKGRETADFTKSVGKFGVGLANLEAKKISGGRPAATKINELGNRGSVSSLAGVIYEAAVSSILKSPQYDLSQTATFDFVGSAARNDIANLYPGISDQARFIEAKISGNTRIYNSMANKMEKFGAGGKGVSKSGLGELQKSRVAGRSRSAIGSEFNRRGASGYIPNFAGGALAEAVAREQAAGLPINQIRINQSGKLRNSQNPQGLAVTNTRDEPTGAIPNFAAGGRSTPATPRGSSDGFSGGILAASTGLFFLSSAFSNAEDGIGKFISEIAFAASALTSLTLLKGPVENIGAKLSGFGTKIATFNPQAPGKRGGFRGGLGRGIAGVGRALPGIGTAVAIGAVVAPLVLELTKTKTGFERLNEELKNIDLKGLAEGSEEVQTAFLNTLIAEKERRTTVEETKKETGIKKETLDEIFAAAAKRVGKETGFKDQEILKSSIAALNEQRVQGLIADATDVKKVGKLTASAGLGGAGSSEQRILRADDLLDSLITAIKDNITATADLAEETAKTTREGNFGVGAVTGVTAKDKFQKNIAEGKFAAGGFDTQKQLESTAPGEIGGLVIEAGLLSKIRADEFALAKAITTESKVALQNQIDLDKNSIEAAKARFSITEEYVKSIEGSNVFRADELEIIKNLVSEGKDLNQIEQELLALGKELNVTEQESFELALAKLQLKNRELEAQEAQIQNQNEINNLNKAQGFGEGLRQGVGELDERIAFFRDELGKNIPAQFSDNLGSALKDAVSEAKTLDEALSDAGRNFLGFMRDAFLEQAAAQATSALFGGEGGKGGGGLIGGAIDGVKSLFGGGKTASAAGSAAGGVASGAAGGGEGGGVGGFLSGIFGGGGDGVLGSTASNPMFVKEVGNMKLGLGQEESKDAAGNVAEQLTGEGGGGEGIFSRLKSTLMESFGTLKTTFSDLFGGLKDGLGGIFKGLTTNLGSLFSGLGGGGGGGGIGGIFSTVLGAFGFANGGPVGFANGGSVGSTDTIPAMLTPGEFVMKKAAVDKYGSGFLSSINEGVMPMRGFQNGGVVGPVSAETGTGSGAATQVSNNSDFTFNIENGKAEQEGGQSGTDNQRDFAEKVKAAVTTVVQEQSRTGGSLNYLYKK